MPHPRVACLAGGTGLTQGIHGQAAGTERVSSLPIRRGDRCADRGPGRPVKTIDQREQISQRRGQGRHRSRDRHDHVLTGCPRDDVIAVSADSARCGRLPHVRRSVSLGGLPGQQVDDPECVEVDGAKRRVIGRTRDGTVPPAPSDRRFKLTAATLPSCRGPRLAVLPVWPGFLVRTSSLI